MRQPAFLDYFKGVTGKPPRWRAICPAHVSRHNTRSLAVFEPELGRLLIKCHAGCNVGSIVRAVGLELDALFPPRCAADNNKPALRKPWRASDVLAVLDDELGVAWVILSDVASGRPLTEGDRARAAVARDRVAALMAEMRDAH